MSGNPPFITLKQGSPAPAQQQQGYANPTATHQASGYGAVPRSMMFNQQDAQYQQQRDFQHMHMYGQYQQPHQSDVFRHTPERHLDRRIEETSDIRHEAMTPSAMCDFLSKYIVYDMEKKSVEDQVDMNGNAAQPTWYNVSRNPRPMQKSEARQRVEELGERGTVQDKMAKLHPGAQRQVETLLAQLQKKEEDSRYCYVIAQLHQETRKIPYEEYLRDPRNKEDLSKEELKWVREDKKRRKAGSNSMLKLPKNKQKRETTVVTVYFKKAPRSDTDVVAMFEMETKSGRATHSWENVERPHQQRERDSPIYPQGTHYSFQQSPQHQHAQNFHQSQYAQQQSQHVQQNPQYPPQPIHNVAQQAQQQPRFAQQTQIPIPPQTVPPAAQRDQKKPIVIHHDSAQKLEGEPVKVIRVSPNRKNKPREKRYSAHSPRSSKSSLYTDDDIFSVESETTRSSMSSDYLEDKRGRTKRRGKGRRERSESTEWSGSRSRRRGGSRKRSTHRPEVFGIRQHTIGGHRSFDSPPLAGVGPNVGPLPPAPPSTEKGFSPDIALEMVYNLGKMEGQKEASGRGINEAVSPRVTYAQRPVMRDPEEDLDDPLARDRVHVSHGHDRRDGSGRRPVDKVYQQPQAMPRRFSDQFRQAPTHIYRGYQSASSDDYPDEQDYEYTQIPAFRARPRFERQSPERDGVYDQAFRQTRHAEGPYMSGGLRDHEDVPTNPFTPMPRR